MICRTSRHRSQVWKSLVCAYPRQLMFLLAILTEVIRNFRERDQVSHAGQDTSQSTGYPNMARTNSSETTFGLTNPQEDVRVDRAGDESATTEDLLSAKTDNKAHSDSRVDVRGCDSETVAESVDCTAKDASRPWTPCFLQTPTLLCFTLVYTALLISLIVLRIVDEKNKGLATSDTSRHYLWTYGPTAGKPL